MARSRLVREGDEIVIDVDRKAGRPRRPADELSGRAAWTPPAALPERVMAKYAALVSSRVRPAACVGVGGVGIGGVMGG